MAMSPAELEAIENIAKLAKQASAIAKALDADDEYSFLSSKAVVKLEQAHKHISHLIEQTKFPWEKNNA